MSSNGRRRFVGRGGARYRGCGLALPLVSSHVDWTISVEVGQVVRRHLLNIAVDQDLDTNENSNNAFHNDSGSESNDEAEDIGNDGARKEHEDDISPLNLLGDNGAGTEEIVNAESLKGSEDNCGPNPLMNDTESQEFDSNGGTSRADVEPMVRGEQGASGTCGNANSRDTNENYDNERNNDRQLNPQGRGRGVGRRGLAHRPAVLDYGLPDDNVGMMDEDFDFILTVDLNTAPVAANPLEPVENQQGVSNVQEQQNPIAVNEAQPPSVLDSPETPIQVVQTEDMQSVARNYNNPTVPTVAGNIMDLISDSTISDADNATNRQELPERSSQMVLSDVVCSEYACTLESNMLEIPSSNEDDTTAESILTASSSLRREIKISLPMLNVDLSPANIIIKGIEEISPNLIVDPDNGSPGDDTPESNSNSHPNSSASNEDELHDEQDLASAENDFRSLDFALIKESMAVEKERTEQDADALLDQVIGGFKDKGMGPNNAEINTPSASDNNPVSVDKNESEDKPSANHDAPFEDCNSPDKTGEDLSIVSLNSSPDVYDLNSLECDSQSNAKVSTPDNYLAKSTVPLSKDGTTEKSLHDDVGEPYVNNSLCVDEVSIDTCLLVATENKAALLDGRDASCVQRLDLDSGVTRAVSDVDIVNVCIKSPLETTGNKSFKSEALNFQKDESEKGNKREDEDCHFLQVAQALEDLLSAAVAASNETNSVASRPEHDNDDNRFQSPAEIVSTNSLCNLQLETSAVNDSVLDVKNSVIDETGVVKDINDNGILEINTSPAANADEQCLQKNMDGANENISLEPKVERVPLLVCPSTTYVGYKGKLSTSHSSEQMQYVDEMDKTEADIGEAEVAKQSKSSTSFVNRDSESDTPVPDPQNEVEYFSETKNDDDVVEVGTNDMPCVHEKNRHFIVSAEITTGLEGAHSLDSMLPKYVVEDHDVDSTVDKDGIEGQDIDSMLAKDVMDAHGDASMLAKDVMDAHGDASMLAKDVMDAHGDASMLAKDVIEDQDIDSTVAKDFVADKNIDSMLAKDVEEDQEIDSQDVDSVIAKDVEEDQEIDSIVAKDVAKDVVEDQEINSIVAKDFVEDKEIDSIVAKDFVEDQEIDSIVSKNVVENVDLTVAKDAIEDQDEDSILAKDDVVAQDIDSFNKEPVYEDGPVAVKTQQDTLLTEPGNNDIDVMKYNEAIEPDYASEYLPVAHHPSEHMDVVTTDTVHESDHFSSGLSEDIEHDMDKHSFNNQLDMSHAVCNSIYDPSNEPHHSYDSTKALNDLPSPKEVAQSSNGTSENLHDTPSADYSAYIDPYVNNSKNSIHLKNDYITMSTDVAEITESDFDFGANEYGCTLRKQTQDEANEIDKGSLIDEQIRTIVTSELPTENQLLVTTDVQNEVFQPLHIVESNGLVQRRSICEESSDADEDNEKDYPFSAKDSPIVAHEKQFEVCLEDADEDLEPMAGNDFEIKACQDSGSTQRLVDTVVRHSDAESPILYTDRFEKFYCQEKTCYHTDNKELCCVQESTCFNDSEDSQLKNAKVDNQQINLDSNASVFEANNLGELSSNVSSSNIKELDMPGKDQVRGLEDVGENCPMTEMSSSNLDLKKYRGNNVRLAENIQGSNHVSLESDVETDVCGQVDADQSACTEGRDSDLMRMNDIGILGLDNVDTEESKEFQPNIYEVEHSSADNIPETEPVACLHCDLLEKPQGDSDALNVESNCLCEASLPEAMQEDCVFDRDNIDGSRPGTCTPGVVTCDAESAMNTHPTSTPAFKPEDLMEKLLHLEVSLKDSAAVGNFTEEQTDEVFVSTSVDEKPEDIVASKEDGLDACHINNAAIKEVGMVECCAEIEEAPNPIPGYSISEHELPGKVLNNQPKASLSSNSVEQNNFDEIVAQRSDCEVSTEAMSSKCSDVIDAGEAAMKDHISEVRENIEALGGIASENEGTLNTRNHSEKLCTNEESAFCRYGVRREKSSEDTVIYSSIAEHALKDDNPKEVGCTVVDEQGESAEDEDWREERNMFGKSGSNISVQPAPGCEVCKENSSSSLTAACARRLSHSSIGSRSGCLDNGISADKSIQNLNDDMFPVAKVILDATDIWLTKISDFCQSSEMLAENPRKLQEIAHECTSQLVSLTQSSEFCQEHAHNVALLSRSGTKTQSASSVHSGKARNVPLAPLSDSSSTTVSVRSQPRCNSSNASLLRQANLCRSRISADSETRLDLQNRVSVPSEVASTSRVNEKHDTDSLSSHSSSCSSMLSEKTGSRTRLAALGSKQRVPLNEGGGKDNKLKAEKNLNCFTAPLYPRPRSTGSSGNDQAKQHLSRPNSSRTTTHGKCPLKDDIAVNQPLKKQQPIAKESYAASKELVTEDRTDRKSSSNTCDVFESQKHEALLEKRRQPHPPPAEQPEGHAHMFKRVIGLPENGSQLARGRMSRNSPRPKTEECTDSATKDSAKQNKPTPYLGIAKRPLLRCFAAPQQSPEKDRQTTVEQLEHKSSHSMHTEKAHTQRSCQPLAFKFKGMKIPFKIDEPAECQPDPEISLGTGDYSGSGKDLAREAHRTEHGQAAGEKRDSAKKGQEIQDFKTSQLSRQRIGPLKLREPKSIKGKSTKMLTMQEFERIQADRHLNQAFARIQSSKPCVDCHMDAKVMDKTGKSTKRRRERVNYDNLIALENIKFLEMLRFKKSAYDRDEQLKEFKSISSILYNRQSLKGVEGKNTKLKQIKAAALV